MMLKQTTIGPWGVVVLLMLMSACQRAMNTGEDVPPGLTAVTAGEVEPASPAIRDQFGQLVGIWDIQQWRMDSTGTFPAEPLPARWIFRYALGGHAVQDFWIEPPLGRPIPPGTQRQYGTNLRAYDAETDRWNIVWTSSDDPNLSIYTAEREGDELVMVGDHEQQRPSRIVYFDITDDSFHWRLEFQTANGWLTVSRIEATRHLKP